MSALVEAMHAAAWSAVRRVLIHGVDRDREAAVMTLTETRCDECLIFRRVNCGCRVSAAAVLEQDIRQGLRDRDGRWVVSW